MSKLTSIETELAQRIVSSLKDFGYDNLTIEDLFTDEVINQFAVKILNNIDTGLAHESFAYVVPTLLKKLEKANETT
jgi:hypothetical protein